MRLSVGIGIALKWGREKRKGVFQTLEINCKTHVGLGNLLALGVLG